MREAGSGRGARQVGRKWAGGETTGSDGAWGEGRLVSGLAGLISVKFPTFYRPMSHVCEWIWPEDYRAGSREGSK